MREIKFRAWDVKNKKMIYHFLLTSKGEFVALRDPMTPDGDDYGTMDFELPSSDGIVLMQFTGLYDRMGKEIYEGDVVNMKVLIVDYDVNTEIDRTYTGVVAVIPSKGACMKRPKFIDRCEDDLTGWCDYNKPIAAYRSEVVGNIYENPELMEGKE